MSASLAPLMSSERFDWRTPESFLELVRYVGPIGLDPCAPPDNNAKAVSFFTEAFDGLTCEWTNEGGLIYVNPPYGRALKDWASKMRVEAERGREIIALTPSRTDTAWFRIMVERAARICFWKGRITFEGAKDPAPFPSAVFYFGARTWRFEEAFREHGWIVRP